MRLTPELKFKFDEVPGEATEIEDILVTARRRDEELAKTRENAKYAGEADPYKHPEERENRWSDDDEYDEYDDDDTDDTVDDDADDTADPGADTVTGEQNA